MRPAWLLLLLTGCHSAEDPKHVQNLLDRTPLPAAKLRAILEIKPGELEIVGGPAPDSLDDPAPPLWELPGTYWIARASSSALTKVLTVAMRTDSTT